MGMHRPRMNAAVDTAQNQTVWWRLGPPTTVALILCGLGLAMAAMLDLLPYKDGKEGVPHPPGPPATAASEPVQPPSAAASTVSIAAAHNFAFDASRFEPTPATVSALSACADASAGPRVNVVGYTDCLGTAAHNAALSERRALSVRQFLLGMGVLPSHVSSRGAGAVQALQDPACQGRFHAATPALIALLSRYRRVEVTCTALRSTD